MSSSQDREIGLAPTFDLSDSESASDIDSDDDVVPPPPAPPSLLYPTSSPRFVQPGVVGNAFELPTDSESDSGSDVAEAPPPPPPPRPSKLVPGGIPPPPKGPPPAASSSNDQSFSFRHKKSVPPPPPPSLPPKKVVDQSKHDAGIVVSQTPKDQGNRKYTYILVGAILVSALMIGLAAGLSKRSNSSSAASSLSSEGGISTTSAAGVDAPGDMALGEGLAPARTTDKTILDDFDGPDIQPAAQVVDHDENQAKTGFEYLDLYEGPKKELQNQDDTSPTIMNSDGNDSMDLGMPQAETGFEYIDEYPGPNLIDPADSNDVGNADASDIGAPAPGVVVADADDETEVAEDVELEWMDILQDDKKEKTPSIIETEQEESNDVVEEIEEEDVVELASPPIKFPALRPTSSPTISPTDHPTFPPSPRPTSMPVTDTPTSYQWNALPEPDDPDEEYFNYSPKSRSNYGPDSWASLDGDTVEGEYWKRYKEWIDPDLDKNFCNSDSDRQSPIDLSFGVVNAECLEYHQIKDKSGTVTIDDEYNVRFEILPSKLRINYRWDSAPMRDVDLGADQPYSIPSADIPKGWGIHLPVVHIDIKVPSEHTINGKRYAAEYQVYLIQNKDSQRGAPAVSVLFDFHPDDRRNQALQDVLDRFQNVWDSDYDECNERRLKGRELTLEEVTDIRTKSVSGNRGARELQEGVFNPWHHELIRSAWFYGYDGSLTEPPCTEFVEWRVIDSPALISKDQLAQMENMLFGHIDGRCRSTSVHSNGSVARPIQPNKGRAVHKCMCRDFLGNGHRKWYGRNRCWEGDEHVFHEQDSGGNFITSPETKPDRTAAGVWNCWHNAALISPCCGRSYDPFHECCAEGTC